MKTTIKIVSLLFAVLLMKLGLSAPVQQDTKQANIGLNVPLFVPSSPANGESGKVCTNRFLFSHLKLKHSEFQVCATDAIAKPAFTIKSQTSISNGFIKIGISMVNMLMRFADFIGQLIKENLVVPHRGLFDPYYALSFTYFPPYFQYLLPTEHKPSAIIKQKAGLIAGKYSLIYRTHSPIPEIRPRPARV